MKIKITYVPLSAQQEKEMDRFTRKLVAIYIAIVVGIPTLTVFAYRMGLLGK